MYSMIFILRQGRERRQRLSEVPEAEIHTGQSDPAIYDVTEGTITLDGVDIREVSQHTLRDKIGYVPQKGVLFSGDIASNILFGNPDGGEAVMKEAAQIAQAEEFIEAKIREISQSYSTGRFECIRRTEAEAFHARAIAKRPELFIFDDSFSALDYKTDVALRKALKKKDCAEHGADRSTAYQHNPSCRADYCIR